MSATDLRDQSQSLVSAIENMSHGLAMYDAAERLIVCNRLYLETFSLSSDVVKPGILYVDVLRHGRQVGNTHLDVEALYAERIGIIARRTSATYEETLSNGRTVKISHRPTADGGWVAIYEDITEKKRAEETTTEQYRRFDAALENMSQGLLMFDADGKLIVRNHRALEIYRVGPEVIPLGATNVEIFCKLVAAGRYFDRDIIQEFEAIRSSVAGGNTVPLLRDLADGRTISTCFRSMAGGGCVETLEDVTERRRAEALVVHMAQHDPLTDLLNRPIFCERLQLAVEGCRRQRKVVAVHYLDLDRFKAVNDTLGHTIGDALLKIVAARLRASLREPGDAVGRIGGDEFAVLQTDLRDPKDASALAIRLIEAVGTPYSVDGNKISIGASIGIAMGPHDGRDAEGLLRVADLALYRAKIEGRNGYRFFEPEMDAQVRRRRELEVELRGAQARGEFNLLYQPIQNLADGRVVGFEALLRWRTQGPGVLSPIEFIGLAEETGLIVPIGEWVLREACAVAERQSASAWIAVNVSAVQLQAPQFARNVADALAASGLLPSRLELEITESTLLDESDVTVTNLLKLHELGVRIALDDFGTGFSSLSYLRRFPFDTIKIDRSFVQGMENEDTAAIVHAIIDLAARLRMSVTAEGVETAEQLERLRAEGCSRAQGFLIGKPVEASEAFSQCRPVGCAELSLP